MEPHAPNGPKRFGVFELDMSSGELRKAGARIRLQDQPLKILKALLEEPGSVVTREDLKHRIWPDESYGDFDHAVNVAVAKLRAALSDSAETPRFVETLPRRGYRFIYPLAPLPGEPHVNGAGPAAPAQLPLEKKTWFARLPILVAAAVIMTVLAASTWWWLSSRKHNQLADKDPASCMCGTKPVVLADFDNTTGHPVFDGTIRQGLAVALGQSPYLSLVSDATVKQTLKLMSQPPDTRLTPELAQQLCIRTGSAAVIDGSITVLGSQYVLGLKAVDCKTGDLLAAEQVTAEGKEGVLKALAQAASRLRTRLGESTGMVEKYNAPLEQVTTPSLEALHAYSLGRTTLIDREDPAGAIQLLQRAVSLDPNFAMAYASLGLAYAEISEQDSVANLRKAYELRERVSDRERFYIQSHYHEMVTGDWEAARQDYELWSRLYPRDDIPHLNLGIIYASMGQFENARQETAESLRLLPRDCISYANLVGTLLELGRLDEARTLLKSAEQPSADCSHMRGVRYGLAFLEHDDRQMAQIANSSGDQWHMYFSYSQAETAAWYGRLRESRERMRQIVSSAPPSERTEINRLYEEFAAESEALFGDPKLARREAREAVARSKSRDVEGVAAVTLALAHDENSALSLADDLARRFPESTLVQTNYLPSVRAQLALDRRDPDNAVMYLQMATPYELGNAEGSQLFPVFLRGRAYLMERRGGEAAAEFQKILDHPGVVMNCPVGALAHLEIARAFAMQGQTARARAAYQDFLTLWKDADPDISILRQAKSENAKLQ